MSVHCGNYHSFYLSEGKLFAWGWNYECVISPTVKDGSVSSPVEIVIPGNPKILKFTNGVSNYTTVVLTNKGLFTRGSSTRKTMVPVLPHFYKKKKVDKYFVEGWRLWVVLKDNRVFRSNPSECGMQGNKFTVPNEIDMSFGSGKKMKLVDVKATSHSLLLTDCGRVYTLGNGDSGERGLGFSKKNSSQYERIETFEKKKMKVGQIAVGYHHSLFVSRTGIAYSCGKGQEGQLGHGDSNNLFVPTLIRALKNQQIKKLSGGYAFSLFLTNLNTVFACGQNESCQLGLEHCEKSVLVPAKLPTSLRIVDIATTWYCSIFVTSKGDLYSCGKNTDGQCGIGDNTEGDHVRQLTKFASISLEVVQGCLFTEVPSRLFDLIVNNSE